LRNTELSQRKNLFFHWAWVIFGICFVNLFINYGIRLGYGVVLPEMIRTLGLTRTQGGDIYNAYLFGYVLASPFTGYLTDRFGARKIVSLYGIVLGCCTILMGMSQNLLGAALSFGLVGIGASAMWTPILTVVQRWFTEKRRGMILGFLSTGFGFGFAVMGRLHPIIVERLSWRYSWFLPGMAALVMVGVNAFFLRSAPEEMNLAPWGQREDELPREKTPGKQNSHPFRDKKIYSQFIKTPQFWIIGFSYMLVSCSLYAVTTFMVDYAHNSLNFPYERASLLATIHGTGQIAGMLTLPILSDSIGRRMTLFLSNLTISLSIAGILFAGSQWYLLFFCVGVMGVFYGITFPMYSACAGDYYRKQIIGSIIGAWTPFYGLGAIVANRMTGYFRDLTGTFTIPFGISVMSAVFASFLMLMVRPVLTRSPEHQGGPAIGEKSVDE
jgi:sugar phosphate permease